MSSPIASPTSSQSTGGTTPTSPSISTTQSDALGNEQVFLKLLVAQMQNQDPLNPTDSSTMVTQLATYSQLEQTISLRQDADKIVAVVAPDDSSSSSSTGTSSTSSGSGSAGAGSSSGNIINP